MGMFEVPIRIANFEKRERSADLSLVVDTGATLSWIPREVLEGLGIEPLTGLPFRLADGRSIQRDIGGVLLKIDGREALVSVVFAESGESPLLGATALETLGQVVDPVGRQLHSRDIRRI